jgi:hypothetical protein
MKMLVLIIKKMELKENFQVQQVCISDRKVKEIFVESQRTLIVQMYIETLRAMHK